MNEPFDILTVFCFLAMAIAFFVWSDREPRTLLRLVLSAIAFAGANQLGNNGWTLFALLLIGAGAVHAILTLRAD
ncbi:XrtV sorting system accessory protein [Bradyrhizobium sp. HKCCYLS3077]|uniref:XrtV sorting system accessory protein n=1 Tax=unclassified Bradyrhizobium TaxID=2631580 RepID=UPI003EB9F89E